MRGASGMRLFLRDGNEHGDDNRKKSERNGTTMPTLMGIRPSSSTNQTTITTTTKGEEAQEVCMLHFQGDSKKLIMPFDSFMEGTNGEKEFVLP
jgi:hypothetical protein